MRAQSALLSLLAIILACGFVGAVEFIDVYRAAVKLEHTGKALTQLSVEGISPDVTDGERRLAKAFLKPIKSDLIGKHDLKVDAMINDIKSKTIAIYHSIANNEFAFGGMKRGIWLGNIRSYASFDSEIASYADGLNYKIQKKELNPEEIECAMDNLKSRHLQVSMFVLLTDLKHLVLNEIGVVNDAILSQLKELKYKVNNDFFNIMSFNGDQQKALTDFYTNFRDLQLSDTEDFLDHVLKPGQLIVGRIFDTCSAVLKAYDQWKRTVIKQATCPHDVAVFRTNFLPDEKVELMHKLCRPMVAV